MKFQDILKIKRANIKVLFCNELIKPPIPRNESIDAQTVIKKITIKNQAHLKVLSPFKKEIPSVPVDIIDELEKIFIFICQPQINTTLKNGDGLNFEILKNILKDAGD